MPVPAFTATQYTAVLGVQEAIQFLTAAIVSAFGQNYKKYAAVLGQRIVYRPKR